MLTQDLEAFGSHSQNITVSLSNELVQLLSDQLYSSPLKAIEELVVNSYDAEANKCVIHIPNLINIDPENEMIIVFDDGFGMNVKGLSDLWQIGRSNKRIDEINKRIARKIIGKFGIGKLATYSIANQITYISKSDNNIYSVSLDYGRFSSSGTGAGTPITLPVIEITDKEEFFKSEIISRIVQSTGLTIDQDFRTPRSWTVVILQKLKKKIRDLKPGKLKWVLATAMPLKDDFILYFNSEEIRSSKSSFNKIAEFKITEISEERINKLNEKSGLNWVVEGNALKCNLFPQGVSGEIILTERSLQEGKSSDLSRSNGFFIKVRDRLVNLVDKDFGLTLSSAETFARFRADIRADDLDAVITAPREGIETSDIKEKFQELLEVMYREARAKYESHIRSQETSISRNKEGEREHILPQLVEHPIADVISITKGSNSGAEADNSWFYFDINGQTSISEIAVNLYEKPREKYSYKYEAFGKSGRLVKYDPITSTFWINEDHDLVLAHSDNGRSRILLEDFVTAEALLEIYLREREIPPHIIGEILEKRDKLLRGLAKDHPYSTKGISSALVESASNDHNLEVNLVIAARSLGFTAKHIAGPNEPDGIARFNDYENKERILTLEAKSSEKTPQLSQLDFAGLREHCLRHKADGCLLIAPVYPGLSKGQDSSTAVRAIENKISCWTISQLSKVIEEAERRHITAKNIYDIVINKFSPEDVSKAIDELLNEPSWEIQNLYKYIIKALRKMKDKLSDAPRTIDQIATVISMDDNNGFSSIERKNVDKALRELSGASKGGVIISGDNVIVNISLDELERRVDSLTGYAGEPLEKSNFRK